MEEIQKSLLGLPTGPAVAVMAWVMAIYNSVIGGITLVQLLHYIITKIHLSLLSTKDMHNIVIALSSQLGIILLRYKWNTSKTLVTWTKQLLLHLASLTQIVVLDEASIMVVLSSESVVIMHNFFAGVIAWVELIQVMVLSCALCIIWLLQKVKFEQSVIMKLLLHWTISIAFVVLVKGRKWVSHLVI